MKRERLSSHIELIHGDCLEVLPTLAPGSFDAVVTDPPYGIGEAAGKNKSRSTKNRLRSTIRATSRDYGNATWDDTTADDAIAQATGKVRHSIIFGGNYYSLPPSSCWLVWDKMNGETDFADCELAWTNLRKAVRQIRHRWHGMIREGNEERFHPTQKPLGVMRWAIRQLPLSASTILDPFGGSGTTGIAAAMEGRHCLLIEKDASYCQVIRDRVAKFECTQPGSMLLPPVDADLFAEANR